MVFLDEMGHCLHQHVERLQPKAQFRLLSSSYTNVAPHPTAGLSTTHAAVLRPHGIFPGKRPASWMPHTAPMTATTIAE